MKYVKYVLYGFAGFNMGFASCIFPIFALPVMLATGFAATADIAKGFAISECLCIIIAAVMFYLHIKHRKQQHDGPEPRAVWAFAGYELGALLMLVASFTVIFSDGTGVILGQ